MIKLHIYIMVLIAAISLVGFADNHNAKKAAAEPQKTRYYPKFQINAPLRVRAPGDTLRILSIDGGGVRGYITAIVLAEFERRTGKPISASFDLIVGTSAGAFNAAFLAKANPSKADEPAYLASDLVLFYENNMNGLFKASLWHKITTGWGYWGLKYPSTNLLNAVGPYFGGARISETRIPVLLTAWDIINFELHIFTTQKAINATDKETENCLIVQAVTASMAYPVTFAPVKIGNRYYIDGGMIARDPSICAFLEGQEILLKERPTQSVDFLRKKIRLVSIGTGDVAYPLSNEAMDNEGVLQLLLPVVNLLSLGQVKLSLLAIRGFFCGEESSYTRLNTPIDAAHWVADDASADMKEYLKAKAENIIASKEFQNLCDEFKR